MCYGSCFIISLYIVNAFPFHNKNIQEYVLLFSYYVFIIQGNLYMQVSYQLCTYLYMTNDVVACYFLHLVIPFYMGMMVLSSVKNITERTTNMLNHKLSIYVPSTLYDKSIDTSLYIDNTATLLSELFGGCTVTECKGYYKADSGQLIKENIHICYAYLDLTALESNIEKIKSYCTTLKIELLQESISLEIDNTLQFI